MKIQKKLPLTIIFSLLLVFVIAFCISGTVNSQGKQDRRIQEKYYREMETSYVQELRQLLSDKGYKNSGITVTHMEDEKGMRIYTVTIHHGRIEKLPEEAREEILAECSAIPFPVTEGECFCKFLEKDL